MKLLTAFGFGKADPPAFDKLDTDNLSEQLSELKAAFDSREEEHQGELDKLAAERDKAVADLAEAKEAHESALAEKDEEHAAELTAKDESVDALAEEKANAILAQAGHDPVPVKPDDGQTIVEKYKAMKAGPEREAFRNQHRTELAAAGAIR